MKKSKGNYLKEVTYEFLINEEIDIYTCQNFLCYNLIDILKTKIINVAINPLEPGFDILVSIKESCLYLGYWAETGYIRLIISSCKNFNENEIIVALKGYFALKSKIKMTIHENKSINQIVQCLKKI